MAISTNQKATIYCNLYENTGPVILKPCDTGQTKSTRQMGANGFAAQQGVTGPTGFTGARGEMQAQ